MTNATPTFLNGELSPLRHIQGGVAGDTSPGNNHSLNQSNAGGSERALMAMDRNRSMLIKVGLDILVLLTGEFLF